MLRAELLTGLKFIRQFLSALQGKVYVAADVLGTHKIDDTALAQ